MIRCGIWKKIAYAALHSLEILFKAVHTKSKKEQIKKCLNHREARKTNSMDG